MYSPEEQQVEICLLKSTLEDIENDLVVQRSALPELDEENDQQYRETLSALRVARATNTEMERLKQENVRLIAKRMQLKKQCEDTSKALEATRLQRDNLITLLDGIEKEEETKIRQYENSLRDKADRFRRARIFYNEAEMLDEMDKIDTFNTSLQNEVEKRQSTVDELTHLFQALTYDVPENILRILGKTQLDEQAKEISTNCEAMENKLDTMLDKDTNKKS